MAHLDIAEQLSRIVGARFVRTERAELATFASDGLPTYRRTPGAVVLPGTAEEVAAVLRALAERGLPFVARGAGTGLSGGALGEAPAVLVTLTRLAKILAIDPANRRAVVEPGVVNATLSRAAAPFGLMYAPDPSSQTACTIGGNVAENAGGPHCLKYGVTSNHVLALEVVLPSGVPVRLGSASGEPWGPDLVGAFVGSEGMFGIATEVTVRLVPVPADVHTMLADYTSLRHAGEAVSRIIAAGITPAAIEMMDRLAIEACEETVHAGYPECGAALVVEIDGPAVETMALLAQIEKLCRAAGATEIRVAADDAERALIWKGRKAAFAAMGRISPSYYVQDGVIPRTRLREVLESIGDLSSAYGLRVANVFHAGDGNLHPLVLYDGAEPGAGERALELAGKILETCIAAGGSITGEHGVGSDKACYMPAMFSPASIGVMGRVRDAFDPRDLCNPGKALPTPRLCGEVPGVYRPHASELASLAERM